MAAKKKEERPVTHICDICGKVIEGEPVYVRTRRRTELWMHRECVKCAGGKGDGG